MNAILMNMLIALSGGIATYLLLRGAQILRTHAR